MKKLNGLFCILALVICFSVILVGCGSQTEEKNASSGTDSYLTITDDADRQVVLTKKPERIVPLSASFLLIEILEQLFSFRFGKTLKSGVPAVCKLIHGLHKIYRRLL